MTIAPERLAELDKLVLDEGAHESWERGACVMEAVAYVAGEPFSDHPACASPVLGVFLRSWNDSMNDEDRQKLKPFIPKLVGTATTKADEEERAWLATDWLVRTFTPAWLRKAGLDEHAAKLETLEALTSSELAEKAQPIIEEARKASDAARAAAGDAAWDAAGDAAWDAARAAAWDAAGDAAWDAAGDAAWDAAWDAARAAARAAGPGKTYNDYRTFADEALKDTVVALQASAFELLDRMIAVGAQPNNEAPTTSSSAESMPPTGRTEVSDMREPTP